MIMADCKLGEKGCWKDGKCHYSHDCENKVLTNADRIRAMSDEELANIVVCPHCKTNWDKCTDDCFACRLEWLKQPAEGE
jgi:hypothetical protein